VPYDYLDRRSRRRARVLLDTTSGASVAPGLKTIEDALEIRRRVLMAFEDAERRAATTGGHESLNFIIVGGGATECANWLALWLIRTSRNEERLPLYRPQAGAGIVAGGRPHGAAGVSAGLVCECGETV